MEPPGSERHKNSPSTHKHFHRNPKHATASTVTCQARPRPESPPSRGEAQPRHLTQYVCCCAERTLPHQAVYELLRAEHLAEKAKKNHPQHQGPAKHCRLNIQIHIYHISENTLESLMLQTWPETAQQNQHALSLETPLSRRQSPPPGTEVCSVVYLS